MNHMSAKESSSEPLTHKAEANLAAATPSEPWCIFLATSTYAVILFSQEDIVTLTGQNPKEKTLAHVQLAQEVGSALACIAIRQEYEGSSVTVILVVPIGQAMQKMNRWKPVLPSVKFREAHAILFFTRLLVYIQAATRTFVRLCSAPFLLTLRLPASA